MKKVMYLFSFLTFMAASNLNAQSSNCNDICPPGCCMLNCDVSQCTPTQIKACKAKAATQANAETTRPKAIPVNFVMEKKEKKSTACCSSLFESSTTNKSCKKGQVKAVKASYSAEKSACCDFPCCPLKSKASKKMACVSNVE